MNMLKGEKVYLNLVEFEDIPNRVKWINNDEVQNTTDHLKYVLEVLKKYDRNNEQIIHMQKETDQVHDKGMKEMKAQEDALLKSHKELEKELEEKTAKIAELEGKIAELEGTVAEQEEKLKMSVETPLTKKNKIENRENKALKYFS